LIDVRETFEFKAGHIEGSMHIPFGELPSKVDDLTTDGPLLMVCKSGARSDEAARFLRSFGIDAENLDGGVIAWSQAGLDLVTPDGERGRVVT
jgi:rhodanese-related sulfurtransferase